MKPPFTIYSATLQFGRFMNGCPVFVPLTSVFSREGVEPLMDEEVYEIAEQDVSNNWDKIIDVEKMGGINEWNQLNGRSYRTMIFYKE